MSRFCLFMGVPLVLIGGCAGVAPVAAPPIASDHRQIMMTISDYHFAPSEIRAKPGEHLELTFKNSGKEEHGVVFDLPSGEVNAPSHARPGETEHLALTVPREPGTYHYHCPVGNHYARGMEGDLIVSSQ